MTDEPSPDEAGRHFWKTVPGILTGVAALLTAVAGLVAVLRQPPATDGAPTASSEAREAEVGGAPAGPELGGAAPGGPSEPPPPPVVALGPGAPACMTEFFGGIPGDRVRPLANGARDELLLGATQSKNGSAGLILRDAGGVVGALRYAFRLEGQTFAVEGVVDARCQAVTDLSNDSRPGGDPRALGNWDDLRMRIGAASYVIAFGYSGGQVEANYFRRVIE